MNLLIKIWWHTFPVSKGFFPPFYIRFLRMNYWIFSFVITVIALIGHRIFHSFFILQFLFFWLQRRKISFKVCIHTLICPSLFITNSVRVVVFLTRVFDNGQPIFLWSLSMHAYVLHTIHLYFDFTTISGYNYRLLR